MLHSFASKQNSKLGVPAHARSAPPQTASAPGMSNQRLLQRKCACGGTGSKFEAERNAPLRRRAAVQDEPATVPRIVHEVLASPGQPLDAGTRADMEPRFGHDFGKVRVHADAKAAESAQAVNALAYTVGRDVVFGTGQYAAGTARGRKLIAHELTHTIQQGEAHAGQSTSLNMAIPRTTAEQEAEQAASTIEQERLPTSLARQQLHVARQPEQAPATRQDSTDKGTCTPAPGYPPEHCSAYLANSWWLPLAYVNNATCACSETPNVPTANCVRKFLQDRLAATSGWLQAAAAAMKPLEVNPATYPEYQVFVQAALTPQIYQDHVDAYRSCCCPYGPAPFWDWIGVTSVPFQPCSLVGWFIRKYGSCTGAPDSW